MFNHFQISHNRLRNVGSIEDRFVDETFMVENMSEKILLRVAFGFKHFNIYVNYIPLQSPNVVKLAHNIFHTYLLLPIDLLLTLLLLSVVVSKQGSCRRTNLYYRLVAQAILFVFLDSDSLAPNLVISCMELTCERHILCSIATMWDPLEQPVTVTHASHLVDTWLFWCFCYCRPDVFMNFHPLIFLPKNVVPEFSLASLRCRVPIK